MMNGRGVTDHAYPERGQHGRVVHKLGAKIVSGMISPGSLLPTEDELGTELGVSRSVLREAVKVLVGKGLVEVRPKVGTRVRPRRSWHLLDLDVVRWQFEHLREYDMHELAEIRSAVEPAAARLAAQRRDEDDVDMITAHCKRMDSATAEPIAFRSAELDFHMAVMDSSHNTLLSHFGAVIQVALASVADPAGGDGQGDRAADLHRTVLDAIHEQDAAVAEQAMRTLLDQRWPGSGAVPVGRGAAGASGRDGKA